jgi:hypothetical protein
VGEQRRNWGYSLAEEEAASIPKEALEVEELLPWVVVEE